MQNCGVIKKYHRTVNLTKSPTLLAFNDNIKSEFTMCQRGVVVSDDPKLVKNKAGVMHRLSLKTHFENINTREPVKKAGDLQS